MLASTYSVIRRTATSRLRGPSYIVGRTLNTGSNDTTSTGLHVNDDSLMSNAQGWDGKNATDSEADVKADNEPLESIPYLEEKTTEWFKKNEKRGK
ncbi:unnamed protein product [Cunninghamella blakesleeana]